MKYLMLLFLVFVSCGPRKPDYVDQYGNEYRIVDSCVVGHNENKLIPITHINGKYTSVTLIPRVVFICDESVKDTVEINIDNRYYSR